jgi:hypothetical protein
MRCLSGRSRAVNTARSGFRHPHVESVEPVEAADPFEAEGSEQADDVALVPIAAAGTLAAGLVLTLDRIRRARLRRRQPHHRIPLPTGDQVDAERRLRACGCRKYDRGVMRRSDTCMRPWYRGSRMMSAVGEGGSLRIGR